MGKDTKIIKANATHENRNGISKPRVSSFERIKRTNEEGQECWSARQLAKVLEYTADYRNFQAVIAKAKEACKNSGQEPSNHFVAITEMVPIGSGAERPIEDVLLSRYACYLIVQNADPAKKIVALGQTYFAVQTRIQELTQLDEYTRLATEEERRLFLRNELREHNKQLVDAAKDAGVETSLDYAIFQNHGYMGLYGGMGAKEIHARKGLNKSQKILDHMGSTELAANLFRATQTEEKLRRDQISGKDAANQTHFEVGRKVRKAIEDIGGTMPEELPSAESIKLIEKKKAKKLKDK